MTMDTGETFELEVAGLQFTCTVGRFPNGRFGEPLATLKYEPHTADTTALRRALEGVIEQNGTSRAQPSRRAVS